VFRVGRWPGFGRRRWWRGRGLVGWWWAWCAVARPLGRPVCGPGARRCRLWPWCVPCWPRCFACAGRSAARLGVVVVRLGFVVGVGLGRRSGRPCGRGPARLVVVCALAGCVVGPGRPLGRLLALVSAGRAAGFVLGGSGFSARWGSSPSGLFFCVVLLAPLALVGAVVGAVVGVVLLAPLALVGVVVGVPLAVPAASSYPAHLGNFPR